MMTTRFLLIIILLSVWNSSYLPAQNVAPQVASAQKIIIKGKEYFLHVVQRGEGLYRISVNYGVSQQEILESNDDINEDLKVGQILRIPVIKGRNSTAQELNKSRTHMYHTVERGQTVYSIARKYNISIESIYQNNPGTREGLVVGAILKIPVETTDESIVVAVKGNESDLYVYHTVEAKETLFGIARNYNTKVDVIIVANPALRDGILAIGSVVRIPKALSDPQTPVRTSTDGTQRFIESDDYLYHTIQAGQTFYSISRQYQIEINKLKEANPGISQDDLKVGYMLRIPRSPVTVQLQQQSVEGKMFVNHRVKRKETLYGISREYHVDMETLKLLNPKADFNNLKKGTTLRIPTDAWFAARTASALAPQPVSDFQMDSALEVFVPDDCSVNTILGRQTPIKVALLFPFAARDANRFFNEGDTSRVTRNLPASATRGKVFTEFYSGMLLALDTLKKQGVNVELFVYDIAPDTLALKKVLEDKNLAEVDLIIGPALAHELPLVSAFSRKHQIPLVYPMSNTNPELQRNPYLFHINTPDSLYYNQMADEIVRQSAGSNLIVILPSESEIGAAILARQIRQKISQFQNRGINFIEYKSKGDDLADLQALIQKDKANYIVVPSVKEAEVSKIIPILAGVREKTKADITLFGMSDWLRFQTIDPEDVHLLNGSIFSPFGIDYQQKHTRDFIRKYRQWFHTEPHAISPYFQSSGASSSYSRYGIWGYDVTLYFVSAINRFGSDFDICLGKFQHQEVQFNFEFKRVSNWGGFYNQGLFIIKFHSDFRTERIPVVIRQ